MITSVLRLADNKSDDSVLEQDGISAGGWVAYESFSHRILITYYAVVRWFAYPIDLDQGLEHSTFSILLDDEKVGKN
jgi:hypothetical protein